MKYLNDSHYELTTGREFYSNRGILGLSPSDPDETFEGYDGQVYEATPPNEEDDSKDRFTPAERLEIAEYMISLWREWGLRVK